MQENWKSLKLFAWLTLLTGIIYPLSLTLFGQLFMHEKANGSLIYKDDRPVGSKWIAQKFEDPKYFWPRPSAVNYNPLPSGGSNLSVTSALLKNRVNERRRNLISAHGEIDREHVISELVYASGSGLDPDISPEAAYFQMRRVSRARGMNQAQEKNLKDLIDRMTVHKKFHILGEPSVNVLLLNLALDYKPFPN